MKKYFEPEMDVVTYAFSHDICEGSFEGNSDDIVGGVPGNWPYDNDVVQ